MKICHFTNTFLPHIGGVARAVHTLMTEQLKLGHEVLVVAPEFAEGESPKKIEKHVARVLSLTHFNQTDFSVRLPIAATFSEKLADFEADIIHSHHPFLLGDTALRESVSREIPLVFTHHTLYEQYTHYLPIEWANSGKLASELATRYANRTSTVIAPSESIRKLIGNRGVRVPVRVVPTGIDTETFGKGKAEKARNRFHIPDSACVIGHVGRLALEKNLVFLTESIARALKKDRETVALIVGDGPEKATMEGMLQTYKVSDRVIFAGVLSGQPLYDAYKAMDLFVFSSQSETQGLVLNEAMASGSVVVALDGPGVREVVREKRNGRLLSAEITAEGFSRVVYNLIKNKKIRQQLKSKAQESSLQSDRSITTAQVINIYQQLIEEGSRSEIDESVMGASQPVLNRILTEGHLIIDKAGAIFDALGAENEITPKKP